MVNPDLMRHIKKLNQRVGRAEVKAPIVQLTGTFVPTYEGATTAGVTTYTTQSGHYWLFGPLCIVRAELNWTAATGTGNVVLGGLPFAASQTVAFAVMTNNVTFPNSGVQGLLSGGDQVARLFSPITNAASPQLTIEAAGIIRYTIVYPVV